MLATHLSHYGLEKIAETSDNAIFAGTLTACKRMAAAHGMEVERYEGRVVSSVNGAAVYTLVDEKRPNRILYRNGGLIQAGVSGYTLVMPLTVYRNG